MDSKKFIEIKKPVEEVREIESEAKLEIPTVDKANLRVEKSSKEEKLGLTETELDGENGRNKKYTEETIGGGLTATACANPIAGVVGTGATAALGGVTGLIGEATNSDELKVAGDTYLESSKKPLENTERIAKVVKAPLEGIKKIFD